MDVLKRLDNGQSCRSVLLREATDQTSLSRYWNDLKAYQLVMEPFTHALISSELDTCSSLLHSLNKTQLRRLQQLQNTAARLVTLSRKFTHITPFLKQLHWLPIEQRIIFKISMFVFKTIHGVSPTCVTLSNCTTHSVNISALCRRLMCICYKRYLLFVTFQCVHLTSKI